MNKHIKIVKFDYYQLPIGMKKVYGIDKSGVKYNAMAIDIITEIVSLVESCKKPSTIHTKIHKNHQDLYDSAFIEGWNFALDKVTKHLLKI